MRAFLVEPALRVEYRTTRDAWTEHPDYGCFSHPMPPPGEGWEICDESRDRYTKWRRVRLVDLRAPGSMLTEAR